MARVLSRLVLRLRKIVKKPAVDTFTRRGIHWHLDLNEGIDFSIYLLGAFEPEAISWYRKEISDGAVVLDIGANIGAHTLNFARLVGSKGRVVAFEPTDYAFAKLKKNTSLNPCLESRIVACQVMLCAPGEEGEKPEGIYSSWPLEPDVSLHEVHGGKLQTVCGADTETVDGLLKKQGIGRIDFIKIDVDGHELSVLQGASETIERDKPPIFIEFCPHISAEHGVALVELVNFIIGKGYCFYDSRGNVLPSDIIRLERLIPNGGSINVLAKAV